MKVGIVALYWPPHYGGAENYIYRLAKSLNDNGIEAYGITPTPASDTRDNGLEEIVIRIGEETHANNKRDCLVWFHQVYEHIKDNDYTHILVNSPLTKTAHPFTDHLFIALESIPNLKIGVIHHDIGLRIRAMLEDEYAKCGDWEVAAMVVEDEQRAYFENPSALFTIEDAYWAFDSPLYFKPDFVIGNTEWSNRFIDPLDTVPKFVLHPILEVDETPIRQNAGDSLEQVNVSMLNPIYHKGRSYMADVVNAYSKNWTYRVLLGSYGGEKKEFMDMIKDSWAIRDGRVDVQKYVEDIREAYDKTDVFIYPSRYEGYGMAAVEPMLRGTPVVVQDYPAILEAVGSGAYTIKWGSNSIEWEDAVEEILFDKEEWSSLAKQRAEELIERQESEIKDLIAFLSKV